MAQLHTLLDYHFRNQPEYALSGVFGDGYLIAHNSIYGRMRKFLVSEGVEFSADVPDALVALPLGQLEFFLESRKLYFYNNVEVLKDVESKAPKRVSWDSINGHLKRNMLFHESCHFFARAEFNKINDPETKPSILQIIIEESFANSCELLAIKDANENLHKHFYEFSSYIFHPEVKNLIEDLVDVIGFDKVFLWTIFCYIYSNGLHDVIPDNELPRVLKNVGLETPVHPLLLKQLKALGRVAFKLNPEFKRATTIFYLTYHGFDNVLNTLQSAKFFSEIENDSKIKSVLSAMSCSV